MRTSNFEELKSVPPITELEMQALLNKGSLDVNEQLLLNRYELAKAMKLFNSNEPRDCLLTAL